MKKTVQILFLFLIGVPSLAQNFDTANLVRSNLGALENDTTYYINGQIKTITRYQSSKSKIYLAQYNELIKTVFQYDRCGNLRNTTKIFEKRGIQSCSDLIGGQRVIKDSVEERIECEEAWIKPLLY